MFNNPVLDIWKNGKVIINGELKSTKVGATTKSNIVSWIKENI